MAMARRAGRKVPRKMSVSDQEITLVWGTRDSDGEEGVGVVVEV